MLSSDTQEDVLGFKLASFVVEGEALIACAKQLGCERIGTINK